MIHFRKLILNNFMSYKDKHVIQLANQGIVRIEGRNEDDPTADSNMAGKSTIVEALLWCLFGKTLRGLKHHKVVNRRVKKNCYVATSFTVQGKLYLCRRYRAHKKRGNRLLLYRGKLPIHSRHDADTQSRLESILDCDYESFVNSVVFGGFDSGTRKQFALQTDAQQKQLLDSFLKFEKFEIALRRTKHEIDKTRKAYSEVAIDSARLRERVSGSKSSLRLLDDSNRLFRSQRRQEKAKLLKEIAQVQNKLLPGDKSAHRLSEELRHCEAEVERALTRKSSINTTLSYSKRQIKIFVEKLHHKERLLGKPCPTCGQKINHHSVAVISKHLRLEINKWKLEKDAAVETLQKLERRLKHGRRRLKRLQKQQERAKTYTHAKIQLEERLRQLEARSSSVFQEELEEAQKRYADQVSRLLRCRYREDRLKRRIEDLAFWEQGFGNKGIKALIVRQALPPMNQKLKEFSQEVFEDGVELEFRPSKETKKGTERELFNVHYSTRQNADTYAAESSGGRRRIDICLLLVFSWFARTCDVLFVDELLDGLDASGRERVLDILSRQRGTVFVISHSRELKSRLGTVWTVRKRGGISRLEVPG